MGPIVEGWPPGKNRSMHAYVPVGTNLFKIRPIKAEAKVRVMICHDMLRH